MVDLDPGSVGDYFASRGTVEEWWHPDTGPLSFHYDAEVTVLDDQIEVDSSWNVLDVGTGRGRFGAHFAARGCRVLGVDANEGMLEAARTNAQRLGVQDRFELRCGRVEELSALVPGRFDLVLCMELFDHLPDLSLALAQMRGAVVDGGLLAFTYVPSESLYGTIGNVYRWMQTRRNGRTSLISRTYRHADIRTVLADAGFRLERYWGVGLLCASAQTRLFAENRLMRALTSIARLEARRWPYYSNRVLARHAAHVVGLARSTGG
jgi:2-polyprenyl-3-methyl-5-hydroxy-6-metoxy-1,4-benzoquinol methylase